MQRSFYQMGHGCELGRQKFFRHELYKTVSRTNEEAQRREQILNSVISSLDNTLREGKQLDAILNRMVAERSYLQGVSADTGIPFELLDNEDRAGLHHAADQSTKRTLKEGENYPTTLSEDNWRNIFGKAKTRGFQECAICLGSNLASSTGKADGRQCVLLSCTHVFHRNCIENFEKFMVGGEAAGECARCPMCRESYEKRLLSKDALSPKDVKCGEIRKPRRTRKESLTAQLSARIRDGRAGKQRSESIT
jgi:hypothetical protein